MSEERKHVSIYTDGSSLDVTQETGEALIARGLCLAHPGVGEDGIEPGDLKLTEGATWADVYVFAEDAARAREEAARQAARSTYSRAVYYGRREVEVESDAPVTFLDEPDTGVEGYAWVQALVLVPAEAIERARVSA